MTSTAIARRFGLRPQGRGRARQGRRPRRLRPGHAVRVLHAHVAHERRLRPVRGRDARPAACATRSAAASWSTTAARSSPSPGTGASCRARSGRAAPVAVRDGRRPRPRRTCASWPASPAGPTARGASAGPTSGRRAREFLRSRLDELPVEVEVDAAGQPLGRAAPASSDGFVIVGSHVDSVPAGGWLDGALGDAAARSRRCARRPSTGTPPVGLRLVDWADEEGARFGRSLFGSSACAGTLDVDEVRDLRDRDGERLEDVVARYDVELDRAHESGARLRGARAYLELHIEQGPVLESRGEPAATVLGTCGVERHVAVFTGQAAHAGATPMELRRDTLRRHGPGRARDPRDRPPPRGRRLHGRRRDERAGRGHGGRRAAPRCCSTSATSTRTSSPRCSPRRARPASGRPPTRAARSSCATSGRSRRSRSTTG